MRFTRSRSSFHVTYLGVVGATALLTSSAVSSAGTCGYWVDEAGYIANAQRGDVLITRVEGTPAGAVTDPLGQRYTHSGIMLNPYQVRHNTAVLAETNPDFVMKSLASAIGVHLPGACYSFAETPKIREGQPGLITTSITDLPGPKSPWDTNELYLLKPKDEGAFRVGASASADAIQTFSHLYDVRSYVDYNTAITQNRSMCSGSVKHATDVAGYGGFNLFTYSQPQLQTSAKSLFTYVYNRTMAIVNAKFVIAGINVLPPLCREFVAAGMANAVVSCFADGSCDRGVIPLTRAQSISKWSSAQLGTAVSISPDNLIYNQPSSLYGALVRADFRPKTQRYYSYTCDVGTACQSGTVGQCPNGSSRYCYNGDWTPCPP